MADFISPNFLSVGNDIVAVATIDVERHTDKKFYAKFITEEEYDLYEASTLPLHLFIWLLWSVKEAVYKFKARKDTQLIFSPLRMQVTAISFPETLKYAVPAEGRGLAEYNFAAQVNCGGAMVHCWSVITEDYIASFATGRQDVKHLYWGIKQINGTHPEQQSAEVREFALQQLEHLHPGLSMGVEKNEAGIPIVTADGMELRFIPISFSHHDRYVSYAFVAE